MLNLIFKGGAAPTGSLGPGSPEGECCPGVGSKAKGQAGRRRGVAEEHLRTDAFNGADGTCHYMAQGHQADPDPAALSDGQREWTLMRFPGLSEKPAVYVVGDDGSERLARQHGAGDFVVVEEIAQHFRLRLGPNVLDIINTGL